MTSACAVGSRSSTTLLVPSATIFSIYHDDRPERRLSLVFKGSAGYLDRFVEKSLIDVS